MGSKDLGSGDVDGRSPKAPTGVLPMRAPRSCTSLQNAELVGVRVGSGQWGDPCRPSL